MISGLSNKGNITYFSEDLSGLLSVGLFRVEFSVNGSLDSMLSVYETNKISIHIVTHFGHKDNEPTVSAIKQKCNYYCSV